MVDISEAKKIVKENLPDGKVSKYIEYNDLFVFQVFRKDPLEGAWDPFFSVNKTTGDFNEFSILMDGDFEEIYELFMKVG